jgi:polyhydroxyalkanoate synthase
VIVASPIKRPYIWDLAPTVSAIRYCLGKSLRLYMVEWLSAPQTGAYGLDEYVKAISESVAAAACASNGTVPFLIGHSLGGTLATIFSACAPNAVRGVVLLDVPLCFSPGSSRFRDRLVSIIPPDLNETSVVPGSLLSHAGATASPETFVWSRMLDAVLNVHDARALEIHARVERWALDEVPLPGQLVDQVMHSLYAQDQLCRGMLAVSDRTVGPSGLGVPVLAVVNSADDLAPRKSIEPFIRAMPTRDVCIIEYAGEPGVALQHLSLLVGRKAYAEVWPNIIAWLAAHR